jgi:hypothetical protein
MYMWTESLTLGNLGQGQSGKDSADVQPTTTQLGASSDRAGYNRGERCSVRCCNPCGQGMRWVGSERVVGLWHTRLVVMREELSRALKNWDIHSRGTCGVGDALRMLIRCDDLQRQLRDADTVWRSLPQVTGVSEITRAGSSLGRAHQIGRATQLPLKTLHDRRAVGLRTSDDAPAAVRAIMGLARVTSTAQLRNSD